MKSAYALKELRGFIMKFFLHCMILCLCWGTVVLCQDGSNYLDLTRRQPTSANKATGKGGGRGYTSSENGHNAPVNPFKVTLLAMDKRSYRIGDEVIFDIELENLTKDPIIVPWSGSSDKVIPDIDKPTPGLVEANISLVINSGAPEEQLFIGRGVYGSDLSQGSLKKLQPNRPVKIRVPGRLAFLSEEANKQLLTRLPLNTEIRVRYSMLNGRYEPATSANGLNIELSKRQK